MPVKLYVSRDSEGRPWPPEHSFETAGCLEIVKRLWLAFHNKPVLYAVVSNLHIPSADLVVISERGLGVIEFKHYPGRIRRIGNIWYADGNRIKSGATDEAGITKYQNPHQQVQSYAQQIRQKLVKPSRPPAWLPGASSDWQALKVQTAVCFTHPLAQLSEFKKEIAGIQLADSAWEEFSVLTINEVADWAVTLQFGLNKGKAQQYEPQRLSTQMIMSVAERLLHATEWIEIIELMPTGDAYAYLALIEGGNCTQVFGLYQDNVIIGRGPNSYAIPLPSQFTFASHRHARITRTLDGVFIEDLESKNGTYINGARVENRMKLKQDSVITLGGIDATTKICKLIFTRDPLMVTTLAKTETASNLRFDV